MSYGKLVHDKYGDPTEVIRYVEEKIDDLQPADDELILQNLASPIHPSIVYAIQGHYENSGKFPISPGNDTVSKVYKKGSKVTKYEVGQRVIPLISEGGLSEYIVVKESQILTAIPDDIDDYTACQFVVNGLTAHQLVTDVVALKEGEWALQTAAASVVGRLSIQIAKAKGVKLINVVRRQEQVEELKAIGADHVIVYKEDNIEELKKQVLDITGGKGVKYAFDAVGGKIGTFAFDVLGTKGTLALYGLLSGQPVEVNSVSPIFKDTSVVGYWLMHFLRGESKEKIAETTNDLINLLREKKVTVKYDTVYEYKDYKEAFEACKSKKVILVPKKK